MYKKIYQFLFSLLLAFCFVQPAHATTFGDFSTTGQAFIVYNMRDHKVLSEENADQPLPIASLTKLMAAITILEDSDLQLTDQITVTSAMLQDLTGWAVVGLSAGDILTVEELLYALLLPSAGDAGQVLAIADSGSIAAFADKMNQKAAELGLTNSHFSNPIGRDEENYSTARDIATLLFYALENPEFKTIFSANSFYLAPLGITIKKTTLGYGLDVSTLSGAKTGYTLAAGRCLASTASLPSTDYLMVTLGHNPNTANHLSDTLKIYNYYNDNFSYREILTKDQELLQIPIVQSESSTFTVSAPADFSYFMANNYDLENLEITLTHPDTINRYLDQTAALAYLTITKDGEQIYETSIFLAEPIIFDDYFPLAAALFIVAIVVACLAGALSHKKFLGLIIFVLLVIVFGAYLAHFFILPEPTFVTTVLN